LATLESILTWEVGWEGARGRRNGKERDRERRKMVRQSSEGVGRKEDRRIVEEEEEKRNGGKYRDV
jgi:hypothetical protein